MKIIYYISAISMTMTTLYHIYIHSIHTNSANYINFITIQYISGPSSMDGWMWDGGRVVLVLLRWQSPWGPRPERRILTISEHNQEQHASSFAILILHLTETNPASVITPIHSPVLVGCMMMVSTMCNDLFRSLQNCSVEQLDKLEELYM